ncbi:hypothetical protein MYX04_10485 [Nitrospiraceae bacterium AH_259_D15_M11_P09]|nr:hypothetical protein [Nitrospiraceae bacterium AH_259_D15_M11_P09]
MTHKIRRIATLLSLLRLTACVGPPTQWVEEISLAPEKARVRTHHWKVIGKGQVLQCNIAEANGGKEKGRKSV